MHMLIHFLFFLKIEHDLRIADASPLTGESKVSRCLSQTKIWPANGSAALLLACYSRPLHNLDLVPLAGFNNFEGKAGSDRKEGFLGKKRKRGFLKYLRGSHSPLPENTSENEDEVSVSRSFCMNSSLVLLDFLLLCLSEMWNRDSSELICPAYREFQAIVTNPSAATFEDSIRTTLGIRRKASDLSLFGTGSAKWHRQVMLGKSHCRGQKQECALIYKPCVDITVLHKQPITPPVLTFCLAAFVSYHRSMEPLEGKSNTVTMIQKLNLGADMKTKETLTS
ncbi:hypothetical protein VNO77_14754 [Canavalia gladiata]|uniref:Uncharacterized protein n=1 Tax=Canavalia gladiata TaxID=3824 RepID=A0AAN9LZ02_CANGL